MNEHNEEIQLKGFVLSYVDNRYNKEQLETIKKWGTNIVRVGLSADIANSHENMEYLYNIIDMCIELDLYVDVIFWNSGDINAYISENVIIPQIRNNSKDAIILVGTPLACVNISAIINNELTYENIMYSLLLNQIPVFVTEWSTGSADATVLNMSEADKLVSIIDNYNLSWTYYYLFPTDDNSNKLATILEYMLNSSDVSDELKQEKIAMLKYTYEQVLASQAEQVDSKANNLDNLSSLGKLLSKDFGQIQPNKNLKVI